MFRKIEKLVSHIVELIGMALLALMVLVVCYTVVTRYTLNYTPSWGEELALLCMVWFGFMSIALGVRDDLHIGVTLFDPLFPPAVIRALDVFKYVATAGFAAFMVREGWTMTKIGRFNKFPGLGITSSWLYVVVVISGAAIIVYCIERLYGIFTNKRISVVINPEPADDRSIEEKVAEMEKSLEGERS